MRVLAFVHLTTVLTSAQTLTGVAVLAIALALSGCGAPQRVQLTTAPISLPSPAGAPSSPAARVAGSTPSVEPTAARPAPSTSTPAPSTSTPAQRTGPAAVPTAAPPLVDATCGSQPAVSRPTEILLACADGSLRLEKITYDSYGPTLATGSAVMHANTCKPNCANGAFLDYVATIRLDDVITSGGHSRFSQVSVYYYSSPGPNGQTMASYPIQ